MSGMGGFRGLRPPSGPFALWLDIDDELEGFELSVDEELDAGAVRAGRLQDAAEVLIASLEQRILLLRGGYAGPAQLTEDVIENEVRRQMMVAAATANYEEVATLQDLLLSIR